MNAGRLHSIEAPAIDCDAVGDVDDSILVAITCCIRLIQVYHKKTTLLGHYTVADYRSNLANWYLI